MKINACVVYLTCLKHLPLFLRSVILLHKNWKYANSYPILAYHDDLNSMHISKINVELFNHLGYVPNIKWIHLTFKMPDHISTDESKYLIKFNAVWMGYRHMCNFQAYGIYETELKDYEYYLRLDSDSYILSPIDYDLFAYMKENDLSYCYMRDEEIEVNEVAVDLWETTQDFIEKNDVDISHISPHLVNGKWGYNMFYNNFELSRVDTFRNPKYKAYYNHINSTGKIYYNRWGDAPIHWFGVRLFTPNDKVKAITDIAYQHNMWIKNLSCVPRNGNEPATKPLIDKYVDPGRLDRFNYAWNRYISTGNDGVNWGD